MSTPVGVAVIGAGMWGRRLLAAVRRQPALNLLACYSRNAETTAAAARDFGCAAAASFEAALAVPGVEAVLLVTPNHVHAEQAIAAAQHGRHVFVEKPIADMPTQGEAMQAACAAAGVTLYVGHGFRRLGAARRVRQLIDDGALGRVVLAEANFSLPGKLTPDRWRYYRATCPGGPLIQLGIHHADTLHSWLGPVASVQGRFARLATAAEVDDVGVAQLQFASGALGVIASSYVSPKTYSLRLYGTRARLDYHTDMSIWPQAERMDEATTLTLTTDSGAQPISFEPVDMLADELGEFARCVRGAAAPETGAAEGLHALQIIWGAIQSDTTGVPVTLGPVVRAAREAS